jgi:hypothetical protein
MRYLPSIHPRILRRLNTHLHGLVRFPFWRDVHRRRRLGCHRKRKDCQASHLGRLVAHELWSGELAADLLDGRARKPVPTGLTGDIDLPKLQSENAILGRLFILNA